jgi:hypothetical protein
VRDLGMDLFFLEALLLKSLNFRCCLVVDVLLLLGPGIL